MWLEGLLDGAKVVEVLQSLYPESELDLEFVPLAGKLFFASGPVQEACGCAPSHSIWQISNLLLDIS